jgi:PPM family protein phosphatase
LDTGVTPLHIECGDRSDQGRVRTSNEDSKVANLQKKIFLVADGMGGHAAGEVASQMAASTVEEILSNAEPDSNPEELLQKAVQNANTRVYEAQANQIEYRGMGSTLTLLLIRENQFYLAQVGDSRAYLLRNETLTQLTRDHSIVWQLYEDHLITKEDLSRHPRKNLITRSIGTHEQVEVDIQSDEIHENDIFLLCSDGLTDVLSDQEIQKLLSSDGKYPQEICEVLVNEANAGGGPDNITVVVVSISKKGIFPRFPA